MRTIRAATTFCVLLGGVPAADTAECGSCDKAMSISLDALQCLEQRIGELLEEARETNPLLVDLTQCNELRTEVGPSSRDRGEIPDFPTPDFPIPPLPPNGDDTAPKPEFLILSFDQLKCLERVLPELVAKSGDPTEFDFGSCDSH